MCTNLHYVYVCVVGTILNDVHAVSTSHFSFASPPTLALYGIEMTSGWLHLECSCNCLGPSLHNSQIPHLNPKDRLPWTRQAIAGGQQPEQPRHDLFAQVRG